MVVMGYARVHVKVFVKVVVIMRVLRLAKELVQEGAIILVCIIAQDVVGRLINYSKNEKRNAK